MKALVSGANGQVGWELARKNKIGYIEIKACSHREMDITDINSIQKNVDKYRPNIFINAAAYTSVDKAESESETSVAVNRDGPANLSKVCKKSKIPLIHISTDYVFDGSNKIPYAEDYPVSPMGVYGKSKWEGEEIVRSILESHIILRVSWVFGSHGNNFVKTMLRLGKTGNPIRVVDDQLGCPTPARDIAAVIWKIVELVVSKNQPLWGTYHYCGAGKTTWYGFAKEIFTLAEPFLNHQSPNIIPITTAEYPALAKRPVYSVLSCEKIKTKMDIKMRPWRLELFNILKSIL